ncbi:MAG: phage tail tape measure protein, partial [Gammaproteobacteria bacterium]|nr:phage tail tape measure protein [Gammaproteobacteria bacterium]
MAEKLGEAFVELVISDKKFQAAIKDAQNRTISAATGMQKSFNSLNMERANKAVEKFVGIALKATAAIGVGMVGAIALSVKRFASFEKEMVNVSTLVDTSKVSMEKLKKGIMELPPELGSATENAAALYQTLSAGVKPAQAIKFLGDAAMAAKAGLTSTFTAVDAGTTILNAFGMESKDAMIIFDQMFKTVELGKITFEGLSSNVGEIVPIFQAAGLATEQMFGALAELTKGGMDVAQASSRLAVTVGAIVKPSSEAAKMAEELGIEFNAAALRAKGLSTFMKELTIATGGSIEKMAMFFGGVESLTIALSLAKNEGIGFAESSKAIADSAGAVKVAFDKQKETLSALWDTFKVTIEKQAILLGGTLAPVLKDIVGDMNDWLNANRDLIATKIVSFANELATAITGIADAWKSNQSSLKVLYEGIETATRWTVLWAESMGYVAGKASIALEKFQQLGREQKKQPQMGILPPGKVKLDEVFGGGSSGKLSGGGGGFEKSFGLPSLSYMDLYVNEIKSNNDKIVKIRKEGFDASLIDAGQYYQEIESYDIDAYTAQMENIKEIQTS